jgi:hypothetical protein
VKGMVVIKGNKNPESRKNVTICDCRDKTLEENDVKGLRWRIRYRTECIR